MDAEMGKRAREIINERADAWIMSDDEPNGPDLRQWVQVGGQCINLALVQVISYLGSIAPHGPEVGFWEAGSNDTLAHLNGDDAARFIAWWESQGVTRI
jgi:hypothetical protein